MNRAAPTETELVRERDELVARLEAINADYRRGLPADSEERAVVLENAETLAEIQRVSQQRLAVIEQQLAQLRR